MDSRRNNKLRLSGFVVLVASLAVPSWNAIGADVERGRMLHDTYCISCHGTQVYKRGSKVATNCDEIRTQVVRWQSNVSLRWSEGDVDAVTTYLARTFYMVPCPDC